MEQFTDCKDLANLEQITHYLQINRYQKAKELILSNLSHCPNNEKLLFMIAHTNYHLNEYKEAIDNCFDALNNGYTAEYVHGLLGDVYFKTNQYEKAETAYLESLSLKPNNPEVLASYGYLMFITGNEDKGHQLLNEAVRISPENEVVLHYIFYYYLAKGKKMQQLETLEKYMHSSDQEISKLMKIGITEIFKGKYKSAREHLRQAYLLDPTNEDILRLLNDVDRKSHFLFFPHRIVNKLGGAATIYIIFMLIILLLYYLKMNGLLVFVASFYIIFALSTWFNPLIYKIFFK